MFDIKVGIRGFLVPKRLLENACGRQAELGRQNREPEKM
jgi:hypothetical protein